MSLLEACFALLESTVRSTTGSDRARAGHRTEGRRAVEHLQVLDGKWMVIAANADNVFRRLCDAMGQPELADDARFKTHLDRGDHQEEIEAIVAEWAGGTPPPRSTRC